MATLLYEAVTGRLDKLPSVIMSGCGYAAAAAAAAARNLEKFPATISTRYLLHIVLYVRSTVVRGTSLGFAPTPRATTGTTAQSTSKPEPKRAVPGGSGLISPARLHLKSSADVALAQPWDEPFRHITKPTNDMPSPIIITSEERQSQPSIVRSRDSVDFIDTAIMTGAVPSSLYSLAIGFAIVSEPKSERPSRCRRQRIQLVAVDRLGFGNS